MWIARICRVDRRGNGWVVRDHKCKSRGKAYAIAQRAYNEAQLADIQKVTTRKGYPAYVVRIRGV